MALRLAAQGLRLDSSRMAQYAYRRANPRLARPVFIWLTALAAALATAAVLSEVGVLDSLGAWVLPCSCCR